MNNLFNEFSDFENFKNNLSEPLEADEIKDLNLHFQKCYFIKDNNIKHINKRFIIKNIIEHLYFLYIDLGEKEFDERYWFFIGKIKNKNLYFTYETGCCGTGFGLGEISTIYLSENKDLLCNYGLTNKQRYLINKNISKRFIN